MLFDKGLWNHQFMRAIRFSVVSLGIISVGLFVWVRHPLLFVTFVFCFAVVLPALALLRRLSFCGRQDVDASDIPQNRLRGTLTLALVVLLGLGYVGVRLAPYVYTPPALTHKNIELYQKCVEFARFHVECQEFDLLWSGRLYTAEGTWLVHREFDHDELRKRFSEHDIGELRELAGLMRRFRCIQVAKRKDIVLFYQRRNMFLPNRPGVAYSLDGNNPNLIRSEEVQGLLPFIRVTDNWYFSRRLVIGGLRRYYTVTVPYSLIDHAACIDGLEEELTGGIRGQPPISDGEGT